VAKLGFRCSPSVTTGEPAASILVIVSRTASSSRASSSTCEIDPFAAPCIAASSSSDLGMLPMGSVGIMPATVI
jgi:hypothetical protein